MAVRLRAIHHRISKVRGCSHLKPGDTFKAKDRDAAVLVAARIAEPIYESKEAETVALSEPEPAPDGSTPEAPYEVAIETPKPKRQYRRRDMTAEE